jgi:hypothetical protein
MQVPILREHELHRRYLLVSICHLYLFATYTHLGVLHLHDLFPFYLIYRVIIDLQHEIVQLCSFEERWLEQSAMLNRTHAGLTGTLSSEILLVALRLL